MKKCLLFNLALLFGSISLLAQITVTDATFPQAGDTLRFAIDHSPGIIGSLTAPGAQDWDYTGLTADAAKTIIYRPASMGSVSAQVPGAELCVTDSLGAESYYNVTSTKFELQAYHGILPYDLIANHLFRYSPPVPERNAPLHFFDLHSTSSGILELFIPSNFPPLLMIQLAALTNNAQIDSIRYRVAISRIDAVDAYGQLSIPGGTYDVLRQKRVQYTETRMDAKIPPLGWLELTDEFSQVGFFGLGVDTTASYYFFNDVAKEPIAIVTLDNQQAFATQIMYKAAEPPLMSSLNEDGTLKHSVSILPNPVVDDISIKLTNFAAGNYRLVISDMAGRLVAQKTMQISGVRTEPMDLSRLSAGYYMFSLMDKAGRVVYSEKLLKN